MIANIAKIDNWKINPGADGFQFRRFWQYWQFWQSAMSRQEYQTLSV
jgi:hypothetical protein